MPVTAPVKVDWTDDDVQAFWREACIAALASGKSALDARDVADTATRQWVALNDRDDETAEEEGE